MMAECEIVRSGVMSCELSEECWRLYEAAFGELNSDTPCRQSFNRDEFMSACSSPEIAKFLLLKASSVVAMAFGVYRPELVTWINPAYFAKHYPDELSKGFGYLQGIASVSTSIQEISALLACAVGTVPSGGICCFDYSGTTNAAIRRVASIAARGLCSAPDVVERQEYCVMRRV